MEKIHFPSIVGFYSITVIDFIVRIYDVELPWDLFVLEFVQRKNTAAQSVKFIFVLLLFHIYSYICIAVTPALARARYNTKASHDLCILHLIFQTDEGTL